MSEQTDFINGVVKCIQCGKSNEWKQTTFQQFGSNNSMHGYYERFQCSCGQLRVKTIRVNDEQVLVARKG